jgi:PrcB C-terminal
MKSLLLVLTLGLAVPGAAPVQFTTLAEGQTSGVDEYREAVIRTPIELMRFWKQHAPGQKVPTVEFPKSMVVGVILGTRNTGGYRAVVTGVDRTGADLIVSWREDEPKPGLMLTQALTSPFHLVTIEQAPGAVKFTKATR